MAKYLKKFENHAEYEICLASHDLSRPSTSICAQEGHVHYDKACNEDDDFEIVGNPSYPSEISGTDTSFDITVQYRETHTDKNCKETIVDEGTDTITITCGENPSVEESRTISGSVMYHGFEIPYSVIQGPAPERRIVAKFNVTTTSSPTPIGNSGNTYPSAITAVEIDGVTLPNVPSAYTFSTLGEHTVKYTLRDQKTTGTNTFMWCKKMVSVEIPDGVEIIDTNAFGRCEGLTSVTMADSVKSINSFGACLALKTISMSNNLETIGGGCFINCPALTSLELPSTFKEIKGQPFSSCSSLKTIICKAMTAPTLPSGSERYTFQYIGSGGTLYVPRGSSGYDTWLQTYSDWLGYYGWKKVEMDF